MKTICCAFHRTRGNLHRNHRIEIVGVARSTPKRTTPRRSRAFPFEYEEAEGLAIGESLNEKERKG
jgi:hypothetical protein